MKISGTFLYYDRDDGNGRIYSKEIAEDIIKQWEERDKNVFGTLGQDDIADFDLLSHSHRVVDLKISEDKKTLEGTMEILDTPKGNMLKQLIKDNTFNDHFSIRPYGTGNINPETNEIEDFKLSSFNIVQKHLFNERCVNCGKETPYTTDTHIDYRNYYIEGVGQLCKDCYNKIYNK